MRATHSSEDFAWLGLDLPGVIAQTSAYADAVAELILLSEASATTVVPGLTWTVKELTTHVVAAAVWYERYFQGVDDYGYDLGDITASNERFMAAYGDRDAATMAGDLLAAYSSMLAVARRLSAEDLMGWHAGPLPVAAVLGTSLNELLIHGRDLAGALDVPWVIEQDAARHGVRAASLAAPHVVDRALAARKPISYRVRVPGVATADWRFDEHGLTIAAPEPAARVDCRVLVDPRAMLLIAYGRMTPQRAALTGRSVAWGRRPLAAFSLADYLVVG